MKNILILGGFGFIGSNIIKEFLLNESFNIIVFEFPGMINSFGDKVKVYYGDFNNEEDVEVIFKENKIDIVIHLISTTVPVNSNDNITYDINSNLNGTVRLLNILLRYGTGQIIFLSSGGTVYGITNTDKVKESHPTNPISSHGIIKLTIEKYLSLYQHLYGLNYLILRVGNPYGPYQRSNKQGIINVFIRRIISKEKIIIRGDGTSIRDYIYINDLVNIISLLIDKKIKNEIINIGSGTGYSINQLIGYLKIIFKNFEIEYTPTEKFDIPRIILDTEKLTSMIEYTFADIESGIRKTVTELKNENI